MEQKILIVDDDPVSLRVFEKLAVRGSFQVMEAGTLAEARRIATTSSLSIVMIDPDLPDGDGMAFVAELRAQKPPPEVLIFIDHGRQESALQAMRLGASHYLEKPVFPSMLCELLDEAMERRLASVTLEEALHPKLRLLTLASGAGSLFPAGSGLMQALEAVGERTDVVAEAGAVEACGKDGGLLFLEIAPGDMAGRERAVRMRALCPGTLLVSITPRPSVDMTIWALHGEIFDILSTPVDAPTLRATLERARARLQRQRWMLALERGAEIQPSADGAEPRFTSSRPALLPPDRGMLAPMAHEAGNLVTAALKIVDRVRARADLSDEVRVPIERSARILAQCQRVVAEALGLRPGLQIPTRRDLHQILQEVLEIWEIELDGCGITVDRAFNASESSIETWGGELNLVFDNLVRNALEAMRHGGVLRVSSWDDGDHILVRVVDSGFGIPAEDLERMKLPFQTTKLGGQGPGLGLTISESVVRHHRGRLALSSEPGRGLEVMVRLPRVQEPDAMPRPAGRGGSSLIPDRVQVAVVDDESQLLEMASDMLGALGALATTYETPQAFLADLEHNPPEVLIADVHMPGMSGVELVGAVKVTHPDMPILLITGFPSTLPSFRDPAIQGLPVLHKPFRQSDLQKALEEIFLHEEARRKQAPVERD